MKNVTIVIMTILLFFSGVSEAQNGKVVGKILGAVVAGSGEKADLTKEQLRDCMFLQRKLTGQVEAIEQINSKLKLLKKEIDKRSSYIKEKRSQVKNLSNKQIESLNKTITKQKEVITKYNSKVDSSKEKFSSYKTDKESFNTDCADKSYNADDMEAVTAEIEKEDKAKEAKEAKEVKAKKDKYSLTINLTPSNSKVRIMNIGPKYKPGILLKTGKYDVYITNKNHHEYREWVEIKDSDLSIDVVLKKK
ncbi:hypothetical protein QUF74_12440 [Candidatus Halobeggiatoa sp. HSG11]|nr:hypothetical protein [Candidatus Halobeggiatoa sp. HSG11]